MRALVPLTAMMMGAEVLLATCLRLLLGRGGKKSDFEDEDFVVDEEVTSRKKVVKKEFGIAASTKPGLHNKAPAKRVPMSKARAST